MEEKAKVDELIENKDEPVVEEVETIKDDKDIDMHDEEEIEFDIITIDEDSLDENIDESIDESIDENLVQDMEDTENEENAESQPSQSKRNIILKKVLHIAGRVATVVLVTALVLVIGVYGIGYVLAKGPSETAKNQFVCALNETSAMKWVPELYMSKAEVQAIIKKNLMQEVPDGTVSDLDSVVIPDEPSEDIEQIEIIDVVGETYRGKLMIVHDPSRVFVGTVDTFYNGDGMVVSDIAKKYDAIGGINGGEFVDMGSYSYTAMPIGGVISQGEVKSGSMNKVYNLTGFTNDNKLVIGKMTLKKALELGVRDAVHTVHTTGPFLVLDGEPLTVPDTSVYGGGKNPRTAIGQREDGAVLLLVIDGRQAQSIGATFKEMAYIMLEYGAVNASCMDGGTSSQMVYEGEVINKPYSPAGPRKCPTCFLVK